MGRDPTLCVHQRPLFYLFLSETSLAPLSEVLYLITELTPPQISRVFLPPLLSHYR